MVCQKWEREQSLEFCENPKFKKPEEDVVGLQTEGEKHTLKGVEPSI